MSDFGPFSRDLPFLLSPDLKEWLLPADGSAHFVQADSVRTRLPGRYGIRQARRAPA
jgi:hypothetical protein